MANFNTHLSIALAVSSMVATAGMMTGLYGFGDMLMLSMMGMVGGLLPDIDLDSSKISKIAFNTISLIGTSLMTLVYWRFSGAGLIDMMIAWGVGFLILRFGVFGIYSRLTRHRGMVHSVPYMAVLSLLGVYFFVYGLKIPTALAWGCGGFVFLGSLVHLLLDEIYSVNVYGLKVKKSFGTALKFMDKKQPLGYACLYAVLATLWLFAPAKEVFWAYAWLILDKI